MSKKATGKSSKNLPTDEKFSDQDFDLFRALEALDKKDYNFFSSLKEEQVKKFVPYMLLHWMSAIKSSGLLSSYYVISTDTNANKHMFNEYVQRHPELQWLMLCSSSPGTGKQFHQWIPHLSANIGSLKTAAKSKDVAEYFSKIYKGADSGTIEEVAQEYTAQQNHKCKLAGLYPNLKLSDIEVLGSIVSSSELARYEELSGD